MRRLALALALAGLLVPAAQAQYADLYGLYKNRNLQGCLDAALPRLAQSPEDRDLNQIVGRCLVEIGRPGEARPYLEKVINGPGPKDWRYAFAFLNLGVVQWWAEDREGARATWTTATTDPGLSVVATDGQIKLKTSGLAKDYVDWAEVSGKHVHCRFTPSLATGDREAFVRQADESWVRLAAFFGGKPDRRVDVLVWPDAATAARVAGVPMLGCSYDDLWVVHTLIDLPVGRYLSSVFMKWVARTSEPVRFFNEGVGEICDGNAGADRLAAARAAVAAAQITEVDIPRWWQDYQTIPWSALKPVAGAFVQTLLDRGGREKFLLLLQKPTYVEARAIYGQEPLRVIIAEFMASLQAG